jgi:arylsulfatase A-like enzyme
MTLKRTCVAATLILLAGLSILIACYQLQSSRDELQGAVLIVLDTVRADHLSCYGHERETSPNLDALARKGTLFERCVTAAPWTLPSMVSLFSAEMPSSKVFDGKLKRSMVETLSEAGYVTAGITEGAFVSHHFGFDRGFSTYADGDEGGPRFGAGKDVQVVIPGSEDRIEDTFQQAMDWLENHLDEKFFLYIHTYEPHTPYLRRDFVEGMDPGAVGRTFTPEKLEMLQSGRLAFDQDELDYLKGLYDGGILKCDQHVGELVDFLERTGLRDRTLVVVTSDHGEEFGEHYPSYAGEHGHSLYDELIMVPLILHNPDKNYGKRVDDPVRLCDVMPTILDCLEVAPGYASWGRSLLPLVRGEERKERIACGGGTKAGPDRIFIRWLDYKCIRTVNPQSKGYRLHPPPPSMELYDLETDPAEQVNVAGERPAVMEEMLGFFSKMRAAGFGWDSFASLEISDESLRERLESLGYVR